MLFWQNCYRFYHRFIFKFYEENKQDKVHVTKGKKIMPGIATFADKPEEAGSYLMPLLKHAAELIPREHQDSTHVFLLGTAGTPPYIYTLIPANNSHCHDLFSYTPHWSGLCPNTDRNETPLGRATEGSVGCHRRQRGN